MNWVDNRFEKTKHIALLTAIATNPQYALNMPYPGYDPRGGNQVHYVIS
jgi:hypothetical protein